MKFELLLALLVLSAPAAASTIDAAKVERVPDGVVPVSGGANGAPLVPSGIGGASSGDASIPTLAAAAVPVEAKVALIEKIAARLPSSDATTRRKNAQWIGEIAVEHPTEAVQAAAVRELATDAVAARELGYFEEATLAIESFAKTTDHDFVFEEAVRRLVEAARASGPAQRARALAAAERIARAGSPARRERAGALFGVLREEPSFRLDRDEVERIIARVRGS